MERLPTVKCPLSNRPLQIEDWDLFLCIPQFIAFSDVNKLQERPLFAEVFRLLRE